MIYNIEDYSTEINHIGNLIEMRNEIVKHNSLPPHTKLYFYINEEFYNKYREDVFIEGQLLIDCRNTVVYCKQCDKSYCEKKESSFERNEFRR